LRYWLLTLCLLLSAGCVQVPGNDPVPGPVPSPAVPDQQFQNVDQALKAKILASAELRDPSKLRRYAALYRAMAETTMSKDLTLMQVIQGGMKATEQFVKPRSPDIQQILKDHMPKPPLSEQDRQKVSDAFGSLGLACHAAAHELEHGGK
jgi:hypothetical protein